MRSKETAPPVAAATKGDTSFTNQVLPLLNALQKHHTVSASEVRRTCSKALHEHLYVAQLLDLSDFYILRTCTLAICPSLPLLLVEKQTWWLELEQAT